ncbi:MAG: helix-turn-helix domain-containing protein [Bacteroidia bacterium]|nr:helix-turn-helix domain-containing protein [Bacteroidia bacterium]
MISNRIVIDEINATNFLSMIQNMVADEIKKFKDDQPEKLLSPSETCKLFQPNISKVTLTAWTEQGKLQDHRIGGRVFYKQSEILQALTTLKRYKK